MMKGSIQQEDIAILNMYVPNNRASKYMRHKLIELQGEIDDLYESWRLQHPSLRNG